MFEAGRSEFPETAMAGFDCMVMSALFAFEALSTFLAFEVECGCVGEGPLCAQHICQPLCRIEDVGRAARKEGLMPITRRIGHRRECRRVVVNSRINQKTAIVGNLDAARRELVYATSFHVYARYFSLVV